MANTLSYAYMDHYHSVEENVMTAHLGGQMKTKLHEIYWLLLFIFQ